MAHPKNRKQRTRQRILDAAARLFGAKGFDATSIEEVMLECGLTRGGFYAHFRSKGQLYLEAVNGVAAPGTARADIGEPSLDGLDDLFAACGHDAGQTAWAHPAWTLLSTDVACKTPEVREAYVRTLRAVRGRLRDDLSGSRGADGAALATMAMVVGALSIASALDDRELKAQLIEACRKASQGMREECLERSVQPAFLWAVHDVDHSAFDTGAPQAMH